MHYGQSDGSRVSLCQDGQDFSMKVRAVRALKVGEDDKIDARRVWTELEAVGKNIAPLFNVRWRRRNRGSHVRSGASAAQFSRDQRTSHEQRQP
jgi:hypothetical protein